MVAKPGLLIINIIDKNLSWDKQIDAVCLNVTRRITLLKLLSKYIDQANMKLYYNSYILPILDYGCLIWGRCSKTNTLRILKLQKRAARIILKADITTPSQSMFSELNWLIFPKRVQYHSGTMVYKALHGLAPEYIVDLFTWDTIFKVILGPSFHQSIRFTQSTFALGR